MVMSLSRLSLQYITRSHLRFLVQNPITIFTSCAFRRYCHAKLVDAFTSAIWELERPVVRSALMLRGYRRLVMLLS